MENGGNDRKSKQYCDAYLEGLARAKEICGAFIASLANQKGCAKITVACANNVIEFVRDDIEAHEIAFKQAHGISITVPVLPMDLGETDHFTSLPTYLGGPERSEKKPVGVLKSIGGGLKKRGS